MTRALPAAVLHIDIVSRLELAQLRHIDAASDADVAQLVLVLCYLDVGPSDHDGVLQPGRPLLQHDGCLLLVGHIHLCQQHLGGFEGDEGP